MPPALIKPESPLLHWFALKLSSFSLMPSDDVEFEVSSDRRTGKPIAVKLLKIKPEVLPEERISGQVGPDLHVYPFTVLHGYIHPVKSTVLFLVVIVCQLYWENQLFCFPSPTHGWLLMFTWFEFSLYIICTRDVPIHPSLTANIGIPDEIQIPAFFCSIINGIICLLQLPAIFIDIFCFYKEVLCSM